MSLRRGQSTPSGGLRVPMSELKSDTELTLTPEWSPQVKLTCDYVIPMMSSVLPANGVLSVSEEQRCPSGLTGKQTHVSLCVLATEVTSCLRGIQLVASSHLGAAWSSSLCLNQPIAAQSGPLFETEHLFYLFHLFK